MQPSHSDTSLAELQAKRRTLSQRTKILAFLTVIALAGLAWGIHDWLAPDVRTNDTWTTPLSIIFFVEMAALLVFCLQELKKLNRKIKQLEVERQGIERSK